MIHGRDAQPKIRVLVGHNEPEKRRLFHDALVERGFDVTTAADGAACVAACRAGPPDLVVLNLAPPHFDGIDIFLELRGLSGGSGIPIVLVAGEYDPEAFERAYAIGIADVVLEPIHLPALAHRIRALVASWRIVRSQAQLAEAQRLARIGSWEWDLNSGTVTWSDELNCIAGLQPHALSASVEPYLAHLHPGDRATIGDGIETALRTHLPFEAEARFIRDDGMTCIHQVSAAVILDATGCPRRMIGTVQDITERKEADGEWLDRTLLSSSTLLDQVIATSPGIIMRGDPISGRLRYISPNVERIRGYGIAEYTSSPTFWLDHIHPEERILVLASISQGIAEHVPQLELEYRFLHKNGSYRWFYDVVTFVYDDAGKAVESFAFALDITSRKEVEAALRTSAAQLAVAQQLAHLGSVELDIATNTLTWSDEMYRIFGLQPRQFGVNFDTYLEHIHPDEREESIAAVRRAMQDRQPYSVERRIIRADGVMRNLQIRLEVVEHAGRPIKLSGTALDITEQKESEERIRREASRTAVLLRIASQLNAELDVDAILTSLCQETTGGLGVPIALVGLYDTAHDMLVFDHTVGIPAAYRHLVHPLPRALYEEKILPLGHTVIPDVRDFPEFSSRELLAALDLRSAAATSMRCQGKLVGALVAISQEKVHLFSGDDLAFMRGLADLAAQAITNAQLFREAHVTRERLGRLTKQVVATQEEERRRLARELHDETGQALTGLAISLKLLTDSLPPDAALARQRAAELITLSSTTMDQIRLLAQDLRPPALDTVGLNLTLDGLCRGFASRTGLEISYTGTGLPELPEAATIALYRFVQEALTNVAKHSGAKHIDVVLAYDAEAVTVSVEDDGAGFDMHAVLSGAWHLSGMGLVGMQERLSGLGGRLVIDTQPGQGTRLVAYVPQEEIL